jgi:glycosyltransferase involved in cell wall biosynthesis
MFPSRLMFVITRLARGGAETQLLLAAKVLKQRGWKIDVVSMLNPTDYVDELTNIGVPVWNFNMRRRVPNPIGIIELNRLVRALRPHVVHSHMVSANLLARVTRIIAPIPVLVCTAHSTFEGGKWRELAYRVTDGLADVTTQVSKAGFQRYRQIRAVSPRRLRLVPNGVDTSVFVRDHRFGKELRKRLGVENAFVWLAVGGLRPAKDYPTMIRAFHRVHVQHHESVLLIAGREFSLLGELRGLVASLGLDDSVRFLGLRTDVPALMSAADAYVMSSAWEGTPTVLLEAGACGLPVVATSVGGNPEALVPGHSGILVPPGDPDALADAMLHVMALAPSQLASMGRCGREHVVANYSIDHVVDMWEELYRELFQKRRRTSEK